MDYVYLLGVDVPIREYTATVIGIIYREDDVEDKLVVAPDWIRFSKEEIQAAVNFQERCKEVCSSAEYDMLEKAFFDKESNLRK